MSNIKKPCPICKSKMQYETELRQWFECSKCGYTEDAEIFETEPVEALLRDEICELRGEVSYQRQSADEYHDMLATARRFTAAWHKCAVGYSTMFKYQREQRYIAEKQLSEARREIEGLRNDMRILYDCRFNGRLADHVEDIAGKWQAKEGDDD